MTTLHATGSFNTNYGDNNANCGNSNVANYFTTSDDRAEILAWLSPLEPNIRHQNVQASRVANVGSWLLETEQFRSWNYGDSQSGSDKATIFCYGNPGAGKTYISSLVIDTLGDQASGHNIAVTCFYFDFAAEKEQTPSSMLGALLKQVVAGLNEIPGEIMQAFEEKKVIGGRKLRLDQIVKMLEIVTSLQRTYICIDAVDECAAKDRGEILSSLHEVIKRSPKTRLFLTGRPHVRSEVETRLPGGAAVVRISPRKEDIIYYIRTRLKKDESPEEMNLDLKEEIVKKIPEKVSEIFLLISLNLEVILQETSIHQRRERLRLMTEYSTLEDTYGATINRIKAQGAKKEKLGMTALMWICHSERPLKADELCHALAIELGSSNFNADNAPSIKTVLRCCQGLLAVDREGSTVRLIHYTLQEYLSRHPDLFHKAHSVMAETCLTYLNSQQVMNLPANRPHDIQTTPFLEYSSVFWGTHTKREPSDPAKTLALKLFGQYENHISVKLLLKSQLERCEVVEIDDFSGYTGLHCASLFGLVEVVIELIEMGGCDINQTDCVDYAPLTWAARNGHEGVVQILLDRGDMNPNHPDKSGRTPLSYAAVGGHEEVVQKLLGRGDVNPENPDQYGRTPLSLAAENGREGVVQILLGRDGANPENPDQYGRTPLSFAAENGREGVVQILLGRDGANPENPDQDGRTPLSFAAANGREGVVQMLLGRGDVNPNHPDRSGQTPLLYAVVSGQEGVVQILLGRGDVNPDYRDKFGRTPLSYAAAGGHEGVVQILLGRGDVKPDRPTGYGRTPLSYAAGRGCKGVVQMLLGRGDVNPDHPNKDSRTPLSYAAGFGREGVVHILLGRGDVNPNHPDRFGQTPLSYAAKSGHKGVVQMLSARRDVNPQ